MKKQTAQIESSVTSHQTNPYVTIPELALTGLFLRQLGVDFIMRDVPEEYHKVKRALLNQQQEMKMSMFEKRIQNSVKQIYKHSGAQYGYSCLKSKMPKVSPFVNSSATLIALVAAGYCKRKHLEHQLHHTRNQFLLFYNQQSANFNETIKNSEVQNRMSMTMTDC